MPLSPKSRETHHTVLDALGGFRSELAANQKLVLRKLDDELNRIKNLAVASPAAPLIPSELLATDVEESILPVPVTVQGALGPAAAWGSEVDISCSKLPGTMEQDDDATVRTFASLPTVAKERKKNLPWIHKHEARSLRKTSTSEDPDEGRVFSQLNAAHATDIVRKAAIENFGSPKSKLSPTWWDRVARHPFFERMSLFMIYVNAVWIAVDIEFNDSAVVFEAAPVFVTMEIVFLVYFTSEFVVRYMAQPGFRHAIRDSWLLFDFVLVALMVLETWLVPVVALMIEGSGAGGSSAVGRSATVLRIARVLRVLRTARIMRVARYMPELMILVKGLVVAARSVFFTMVLLLLITYVFSIAFLQLSQAYNEEMLQTYFPTMPQSVLTLIVYCIMPDQKEFFDGVTGDNGERWFLGALVIVYVLVGSLIVMNMLVGILVEAVQTVATMEHEQIHVDFAKRASWTS